MPINQESFNKNLYDLLRTKGLDPKPLNSKGETTPVPNEADVFKIEIDDKNVWITIDNAKKLKVYFDDKVSSEDSDENEETFHNLLKHLKYWSQRRQLGFELQNRDHLSSDMAQREYMKKKEQLGEGYYPMGKKASYNDSVPQVKIILQHTRQIEEGEQRFRNVAKIFVENVNGERFLLPTNRPGLARVYARHVAEGGTPYDERGGHITTLVEEYTKMAGFVRATRNNQFNESAQRLVNEGLNHYQNLRETLSRMTGHRGYNNYFESYTPVLNEESTEETNLNELFVQETLDPRIENVLPILNRLSKNITEMSAVKELEEWAESITEVEDQTTKTLAEPAVKELDETATIDPELEAQVVDMYREDGMKEEEIADSMGISLLQVHEILAAYETMNEAPGAETLKHNQNTEKSNLKAFDLAEGPADEPVEPDMDADDKRWDDVEDVSEGSMKAAMHHDAENMSLKEFLIKYGDDDFAKEFWHTVNGVDEGLDANQKRVGQLGPTEKVGKEGAVGKLVGASESREFDDIKRLAGL